MPSLKVRLADIASSRFAAHGDFSIWTDGDLLCYDVTGPFNLEWVQALGLARRQIVGSWRPRHRVGALVHWHRSSLMSPEALQAYEEGFAQFKQTSVGPAALAWVADGSVEGMVLLRRHFDALFRKNAVNFRFFDDLAAGRAWVEQEVARVHQAGR